MTCSAARLIMGLALSMAVAVPASAQRTGTRLDRNQGAVGSVSTRDPKTAIRATHAFGQCIAFREKRRVRRALDLPFASAEQLKVLNDSIDTYDECLGSSREFDQLAFSRVMFAGSTAEFFVRTEQATSDLTPLAGMTDEALAQTGLKPRNDLEDMGLCIVRRNPGNARAFVMSRPTESDEGAAMKALVPNIGPCLFEGQQVTMNAANLRAIVAYALYRAASKLGAPGA